MIFFAFIAQSLFKRYDVVSPYAFLPNADSQQSICHMPIHHSRFRIWHVCAHRMANRRIWQTDYGKSTVAKRHMAKRPFPFFKQAAIGLYSLPCSVMQVIPNRLAWFHYHNYFPAVSVIPFSKRSDIFWSVSLSRYFLDPFLYQDIFLIHFCISFLYNKSLVSINKQVSIDSFVDCKGHHWDICCSSSPAISAFASPPPDTLDSLILTFFLTINTPSQMLPTLILFLFLYIPDLHSTNKMALALYIIHYALIPDKLCDRVNFAAVRLGQLSLVWVKIPNFSICSPLGK